MRRLRKALRVMSHRLSEPDDCFPRAMHIFKTILVIEDLALVECQVHVPIDRPRHNHPGWHEHLADGVENERPYAWSDFNSSLSDLSDESAVHAT